LKVCKILRKIKIDYGRIFNSLQNWNLISLKFLKLLKFLLGILKKIKNIIKILVNSSKYEVKILNFKEIKSHFCRGLKIYFYFSQNLTNFQNNFINLKIFKLFFFLRVITQNRTCYDP
jgi:hypothetical protein